VTDRPPEGFDVPVTRIGGGGGSVRGRLAAVAVVLIAAGWLVVTRSDTGPETAATLPRGSGASPAGLGASSRPSPTGPPQPNLPNIPDVPLANAPVPVFVVRDGNDARLLGWEAGAASLKPIGRAFPVAFGGAFWDGDSGHFTWLSPDLASLVVLRVASGRLEGQDAARLVTADGVAWDAAGLTGFGGLVWSSDGSRFAVAGRHDHWLLVRRQDGGWATRAEVDVSAGRPPSPPAPSPDPNLPAVNAITPAAFSVTHEWVIGARYDQPTGALVPAVRVRFDDPTTEALSIFPIEDADAPDDAATRFVDVATGRTVVFGANGSIPGGPPQLEIRDRDGSYAFGVRSGVVMDWRWVGDGRLLVLSADGSPFPARWTLQLVDGSGESETLVDAPRASVGALLGAKDGYAGLLLTATDPIRSQIVLVRLADGAASAATVDFGAGGPIGFNWAP
jgi:hypothetical protein